MSVHTGAHIDAPFHFVEDGSTKTKNSRLMQKPDYDPDFVAFSVEAARVLVARGVKLGGLDYLSIAHAGDQQVPVHAGRFCGICRTYPKDLRACLKFLGFPLTPVMDLAYFQDRVSGNHEAAGLPIRSNPFNPVAADRSHPF